MSRTQSRNSLFVKRRTQLLSHIRKCHSIRRTYVYFSHPSQKSRLPRHRTIAIGCYNGKLANYYYFFQRNNQVAVSPTQILTVK